MKAETKDLLSKMTLEEKAGLCSGANWWHTKTVERIGLKDIMVSDGPSGLRKHDSSSTDENFSIKAISFPSGCATAASFDRNLLETEGHILGNEAAAEKVAVLLGPAINMKRSPLCGRNFEYFSEDPYLAGELSTAYVKGVQSEGVGVSVKHFAANNQEYRRFSVSEKIDQRTLREIYLPAFETTVKKAAPATLMCSYNAINGELSSENKWLLTDILRNEWGFKGFVISDWGAVNDRVKGIQAGLNLEMPYAGGITDQNIVQAVKDGTLKEEQLDNVAGQILDFITEYYQKQVNTGLRDSHVFNKDQDHILSGQIAEECCVLLKNSDNQLPLKIPASKEDILFAGEFAKVPRFEGGGSSNIKTWKVTDALSAAAEAGIPVSFAQGYNEDGVTTSEKLIEEAVEKAKKAKAVVIFAGLPDSFESECFDRKNLNMPESHNTLIEKIAEVNSNITVVLHNGAPVEMPWINNPSVKAVLECYLGGEAIGQAQVSILFGKTNPSGKLPETFPLRLEDNPSFIDFPGNGRTVTYSEGIFIGYRWYEKRKIPVLFPFGHGLSYTNFEYNKGTVSLIPADSEEGVNFVNKDGSVTENSVIQVSVKVKNTGKVAGKEVIQLYVSDTTGMEVRPVKELKGFEKIQLQPGEEQTVNFILNKRSFAYWNQDINDWYIPTGTFNILIGASSADIRCQYQVNLKASAKKAFQITKWTTAGDMLNNPEMKPFITDFIVETYGKEFLEESQCQDTNGAFSHNFYRSMYLNDPFRQLRGRNGRTEKDVDKFVEDLNKKLDQ